MNRHFSTLPSSSPEDIQRKGFDTPKKCQQCRNSDKSCDAFTATGTCPFGERCKYKHDGQDSTVGAASAGRYSGKRAHDMLPGSIKTECRNIANNTCHLLDNCPFTHPGREKEQKLQARVYELSGCCGVIKGGPQRSGRQ